MTVKTHVILQFYPLTDLSVAKATTDYVNSVILKVEAGDAKGGLNIHSKKS